MATAVEASAPALHLPVKHVEPTNIDRSANSKQTATDTLKSIKLDSFKNDGDRTQALLAAYDLVARLETPWEFIARFCMGQVLNLLSCRSES